MSKNKLPVTLEPEEAQNLLKQPNKRYPTGLRNKAIMIHIKAAKGLKDSLTTDIVGSFNTVKYEDGYVVNFEDIAYWYVKNGKVYSLNYFAKTYAAGTGYKYGINWNELF